MSFIDEFEDLILGDVQKEGYEAEEEVAKLKERTGITQGPAARTVCSYIL